MKKEKEEGEEKEGVHQRCLGQNLAEILPTPSLFSKVLRQVNDITIHH